MDSVPRFRVLVVGDSGVGKSSIVHALCTKEKLANPKPTVGCSPEVCFLDLGQGRALIEFWDIGGHPEYRFSRTVLYEGLDAILFVYDLTSAKSQHNLKTTWMQELTSSLKAGVTVSSRSSAAGGGGGHVETKRTMRSFNSGFGGLPTLIVGNKLDRLKGTSLSSENALDGAIRCSAMDPRSCHRTVMSWIENAARKKLLRH